jgi:hypothetical protein
MTSDTLVLLSGAVISLLFSYVPGLNSWFDALKSEYKRLIMAGLMLLVGAGAFGLACAGLAADFGVNVACDQAGGFGLMRAWVLAIIANQGAYKISKG